MKTYDYIIIGGGIAGLYSRYLLSKYNVLLLEKEDYIGGRGIEKKFHDDYIKLGAGIGAPDNKHLLKVLNKLKIKYYKVQGDINVAFNTKFNMNKSIDLITNKYLELKKSNNLDIKKLTVKEFIEKYFGKEFFNQYSLLAEYTDFFNSDLEYFIKYYPIADHKIEKYKILYISWTELIQKLKINGVGKIKTNFEVKTINKINDDFIINNKLKSKNVIFTVTINALNKILKKTNLIDYKLYSNIKSVPFIRIYTYHKHGHNLDKLNTIDNKIIDRYNLLSNHLQKIIIISENILMICYADNDNAKFWHKYLDNKDILIKKIMSKLKNVIHPDYLINFSIDDIFIKYWDEGIHYYKPHPKIEFKKLIKKLQNPIPNIYVGGEMLSLRQGWVEGAIESIDRLHELYF
jgi:hypothetical protein